MKLFLTSFLFITLLLGDLFVNSFAGVLNQPELSFNNSSTRLFMHFDRSDYRAGDFIWFKAYVFNTETLKKEPDQFNLMLELFNINGKRILNEVFKVEEGVSNGQILLDTSLPDGNYFLRAYTLLPGDDLLFKEYYEKSFYISNDYYSNSISRREISFNRDFNRLLDIKKKTYRIEVHAEGGSLVHGHNNLLAIRVLNEIGEGVKGSGRIYNSKGEFIAEFTTSDIGIGSVFIIPKENEIYSVEFISKNGVLIRSGLLAVTNGPVLKFTQQDNDSVFLELIYTGELNQSFMLYGIMHGQVFYEKRLASISVETSPISVFTGSMPNGIIFFVLVGKNNEILSVRPFQIYQNNLPALALDARIESYQNDKVLNLLIEATDANGIGITGDLSLSVLPFGMENESSLMFRNSLFGSIYGIGFSNHFVQQVISNDNNLINDIDLMLLTTDFTGLTFFDLVESIDIIDRSQRVFGIHFNGLVTDPTTNQPVSGVNVQLTYGLGIRKTDFVESGDRGVFSFRGLEFNDSLNIQLRPEVISGSIHPKIQLLPEKSPLVAYTVNSKTKTQRILARGREWKRPKRPSAPASSRVVSPYGNPDQTININERVPYFNLLRVLEDRAIGLIFTGNQIMFRGPSSFLGSNEPLFIKDNIIVSKNEFLSQDPNEVERIELFKGANAALFGARGANGAIISYSRRSREIKKFYYDFVLKGFTTPKSFNSDSFTSNSGITDINQYTILWEPNLHLDDNGYANIRFIVPENINRFRIIIQGLSPSGELIYGEFIVGN